MAETEVIIERRYGVLQITPEFFVEMCKRKGVKQTFEVVENPLPDDARFVGIGQLSPMRPTSVFDVTHAVLGVIVESPTFPPVKSGEPIPILPPPMFRLVRDEHPEEEIKLKCPACGGESFDDPETNSRRCACGWEKKKK